LKSMKILMIDDEKGFREILHKRFKAWGYEVHTVQNAREGVRRLEKEEYNIILLDIVIPNEEFDNNFRAVRKKAPDTPIVIMTGLTPMLASGLFDSEIKSGMSMIIYKPFRFKELIFVIEEILEAFGAF